MPSNPSGPIRRAQLISPFGVGALVVVPGGTSLVIGGLDSWYRRKDDNSEFDLEEFIFEEWRLQKILGVNHFRLPPDFREAVRGQKIPNIGVTIPAFRFPTWHFCPDKSCRLLTNWPMYTRGVRGRIKCPECEKKKKTRYMFQVPFVAMCDRGHLQDFPWREWVHRKSSPSCFGMLRLNSTGSATLAGQVVKCDGCGKERTLAGITNATPAGATTLSSSLEDGTEFLCLGIRPWLGPENRENCNAPLRGSLRSASNLYFAKTVSSIYLPRVEDADLYKLEDLLQSPLLSTLTNALKKNEVSEIAGLLKTQHPKLLAGYTEVQIISTLNELSSESTSGIQQPSSSVEDERTTFRRAEYAALKAERNDAFLKIKKGVLKSYDQDISKFFSRIMLVSKLRETRAFAGFTRIFPENDQDQMQRQSMLWKSISKDAHESWLPAHIVYGEGVFFEFDENLLTKWENRRDVIARIKPLMDRFKKLQDQKRLEERPLVPRFILVHTFAHVVLNRLTYECGYSSAALRERLYVSNNADVPMAGVLIYTADGDSEGTMGGLVRMGKPGNLEPVIRHALEDAKWCSADPVCMEMGHLNGQGPDSCNLAACHNCALVPETACEEFNRFLDRGVLIGDLENLLQGYFSN
jgi:uncharacterized protein DUF1998